MQGDKPPRCAEGEPAARGVPPVTVSLSVVRPKAGLPTSADPVTGGTEPVRGGESQARRGPSQARSLHAGIRGRSVHRQSHDEARFSVDGWAGRMPFDDLDNGNPVTERSNATRTRRGTCLGPRHPGDTRRWCSKSSPRNRLPLGSDGPKQARNGLRTVEQHADDPAEEPTTHQQVSQGNPHHQNSAKV